MMILEYQADSAKPKVRIEMSPHSTLEEALETFEGFLLAAGYCFRGQVVIQDDEEN